MRKSWLLALFLAVGVFVGARDSRADYPTTATSSGPAWMTDGMEKLHVTQAPNPARPLYLSGGRNSFIDFQVHVRDTAAQPYRITVSASDFVGASGAIAASNVILYREDYIDITTLSDVNGLRGWTPDPLTPAVDPYFHQARKAFPIVVPLNGTRSVWVDVYVPPATPPGLYTGTITVKDGASVLATLSPTIKVWGFTLPSTATLASVFGAANFDPLCVGVYGSYANCAAYPGAGGNSDTAVDLTSISVATLLLDHRLSYSETAVYKSVNEDWTRFDATYGPALSGTAPTLTAGAALRSSQLTYNGTYTTSTIADWVTHYQNNWWLPKLFDYTCDEPPNGCSWDALTARANFMHSGSPLMSTLVTTDIDTATAHNLLDAIDIMVPLVTVMEPRSQPNQRAKYVSWLRSPHKRLYWYQSCSTHESCSNGTPGGKISTWPSYMIDATPVRNRVFQWLAFLDNIQGELYYAFDYCWTPGNCAGGDPWTSVYAFGGNGDGTLLYPGKVERIGGSTPIPLPSIRLKLIRDGMQDYELLYAASAAGLRDQALAAARSFITNAKVFSNDPNALVAARESLGDQLDAATPR